MIDWLTDWLIDWLTDSVASIPIEAGRNLRPLKNRGGGSYYAFQYSQTTGRAKKVIP